MTCPNCGKKLENRKAEFCGWCGAAIERRRFHVKWWMIVLPILLAALTAGGIWYARTQKQPTEMDYYNEDGDWVQTQYYDENDYLVGFLYASGSKGALETTAASKKFDVSEDRKVKGADHVKCGQWVYRFKDEDPNEQNIMVLVYDKDDNLLRSRSCSQNGENEWETSGVTTYTYDGGTLTHYSTVYYDDGEVSSTWETECNRHGDPIRSEHRTADGERIAVMERECTYFFGTIRKVHTTQTTYMEWNYNDGQPGYEALEKPLTVTGDEVYHYTFGLLTSADATGETDDPDTDEDSMTYRVEYQYD